ncbi:MAG: FAD-dependent monooxygenase [Tannerella sp.]|nr:FAD-dependent monooxygenase [Tannerella sp.]
MIKEISLRVLPQEAVNEASMKAAVCRELSLSRSDVTAVRVIKRSIDARQRQVYINLTFRVFINEEPPTNEFQHIEYQDVSRCKPIIIVGAGPCGLFAALKLLELGMKPIVIERGKDVHERKKDIAQISRSHSVNPESNYCFGEGGAGAYSDGKLFTRSKKRGSVERILNIFCQHGASPSILVDAHPHIGTDRLPRVIENIRKTIINSGGEVIFNTRMTALLRRGEEIVGIQTADGKEFIGSVILATGHSARDVYRYLASEHIALESKGIAVGVRLEHPQVLIDRIRYHSSNGRGLYLPAAEYSFTAQSGGRGVYSFCMCPGGFVVPAASTPEQVVVNGMSSAARNSPWANAGMVVEVQDADLIVRGAQSLTSLSFLESLEHLCWQQGGMRQTAPAQRMGDFVQKRLSASLPESSYTPGLVSSPLHDWMPEFITERLRDGFRQFDKVSRGFLTDEAVLIGVETRTSSPVRIPRDAESMQHITLKGLYPCGEGAGYAGGIVSAAIDGELCAEKAALNTI